MSCVEVEVEDGVGWVYLNRPEKLNALNTSMLRELSKRIREVDCSEDVRVVVLSGRGKFFSAGMDLEEIAGFKGYSDSYKLFYEGLYGVTRELLALSKPLIIGVNGPAIGGALELLYAGDLVVASKTSYFQMVEVRWGFS